MAHLKWVYLYRFVLILDEYRVLTAHHCNITKDHIVFAGGIDYDGSDVEQKKNGILNVTYNPNLLKNYVSRREFNRSSLVLKKNSKKSKMVMELVR